MNTTMPEYQYRGARTLVLLHEKHLLSRWRAPLAEVPGERFEDKEYRSRWGVLHSIEAMLEHAVMHPIRHSFQLTNLMEEQRSVRSRD